MTSHSSPPPAPSGFIELELVEDHGPVVASTARSAEQGRRVALWFIGGAAFDSPLAARRFADAAQGAMRLGSALVAPPLSLTQTPDGGFWLSTDLPQGMTLDDVLALRGALAPDDVGVLAQVLCDALTEVHAAGLVHRGLRPRAVEVLGDVGAASVRLGDFGLGHLPLRGSARGPGGALLLDPAFAAPECVQGAEPSPASDLYALGCLLYAACTGAPPFSSADPERVLHAQVSAAPPPLPAGVDGELARAILCCLEKDPARRPMSARELAGMLGRLNRTMVSQAPRSSGKVSYPALPQLPPARPGEEAPGDSLGIFKLVRLLGEGAMGRVFLAQHQLLGRQVALKILRPEQYKKADLIQRFIQEARTVNQINHEHIVEIIDFVVEEVPGGPPRSVYCVMEFLEGETLTAAMAKGPVPLARVAHIVGQLCGALAAAHKVGVVHRDLKPDNIFLIEKMGDRDYVKVLDFGVAKLTAPLGDAPLVSTLDGALIGTPIYMSPEQAAGQPVDHRSDVYAAGVMLYELLTGAPPFDAPNFGALAVQIITQAPPPLPERTRSGEPLPPRLKELVLRCLEKDAAKRPQSMGELAQALGAASRGELLPSEADVAAIKKGPGALAWAALAVLALGAGGGLWAVTRPSPETPVAVVDPKPVDPVGQEPPRLDPPVAPEVDAGEVAADAGLAGASEPPPVEPPVEPPPPPKKVLAKLGPKDIAEVVTRGQKQVQACIKRHRVSLGANQGEVKVVIKVEPSGRVSQADLTPAELAANPFGQCVVKEVRAFDFPRFRGKAVKFAVPFSWNLSG